MEPQFRNPSSRHYESAAGTDVVKGHHFSSGSVLTPANMETNQPVVEKRIERASKDTNIYCLPPSYRSQNIATSRRSNRSSVH